MAVVVTNFIPQGGRAKEVQKAKANVKYIQNRRGKDGQRIQRVLFGNGGTAIERTEAYRMIDEAEQGSRFFRIKISPDPKKEDTQHDLYLREVTQQIMDIAQETLGKPVVWVAAIHADHTEIRHVHVLAAVKTKLLPVKAMIQKATEVCRVQRKELDLGLTQQKQHQMEKEGTSWELELER